jgi:isopenicillin N synthase-like dioxygenase
LKRRIAFVFFTNMTEATDIAVVSFDKFMNGDGGEKRAVAKQLYEAFSTAGWLYLKDFGIPQERTEEIFRLAYWDGFYVLAFVNGR